MNTLRRTIGQLLIEAGFITHNMLETALKVQASGSNARVGDILESLGFITDVETAKILAKQSEYKYFALENFHPKKEILNRVPYKFAEKFNILPLFFTNDILTVAVSDPFSVAAKDYISQFVSETYQLVVAPRHLLQREIEYSYHLAKNSIQNAIDNIQSEIRGDDNLRTAELIEYLNQTAVELNASDMHISATEAISFVSYRVDGVLQLRYTFPSSAHTRIVSAFKLDCGMDITESIRPQDGHGKFEFLGSTYDLRVSSMPTTNGENLVVRFLTSSQDFKSLEDLGFASQQLKIIKKYLDSPSGVILCTGPTGSGKTTTLYSMIRRTDYIQKNVLTVEDPVEFRIPLIKQVSVNEKAGITFSSAIKSFLRQDPDILLIGEIRDEETAQLAIRAAQTGHLLLSSLHTNDAVGSVARLRDLGVGNYLLATTLSCVIAQRLVRKLCPMCKKKVRVSRRTVDKLELSSNVIYRKHGCVHCFDTGYLGRIAVAEVLEFSNELRFMIDQGDSPMRLREQSISEGMIPIKQSIKKLIQKGITDDEEYHRVTYG